MKKTDIAMIVLIASVSVMVAFFVANAIPFLKLSNNEEKVKVTEPIKADKPSVDAKIFRSDAINPTVETIIGGN